jgi:hypothetical protein
MAEPRLMRTQSAEKRAGGRHMIRHAPDHLKFQVWNPQSGKGPATCELGLGDKTAQMALIGRAVILSPGGKARGPVWKTAPATKRSPSSSRSQARCRASPAVTAFQLYLDGVLAGLAGACGQSQYRPVSCQAPRSASTPAAAGLR